MRQRSILGAIHVVRTREGGEVLVAITKPNEFKHRMHKLRRNQKVFESHEKMPFRRELRERVPYDRVDLCPMPGDAFELAEASKFLRHRIILARDGPPV